MNSPYHLSHFDFAESKLLIKEMNRMMISEHYWLVNLLVYYIWEVQHLYLLRRPTLDRCQFLHLPGCYRCNGCKQILNSSTTCNWQGTMVWHVTAFYWNRWTSTAPNTLCQFSNFQKNVNTYTSFILHCPFHSNECMIFFNLYST